MQARFHFARRRLADLRSIRVRRIRARLGLRGFSARMPLRLMRGRVPLPSMRGRIMEWLSQGLSPGRLALTLALGLAVGCVPLLGVTTVLCAGLAFALRLNMPAIQAANWVAMPLQVVLLLPFLRLGQRLFAAPAISLSRDQLLSHLQSAPWNALAQMSGLLGHALLAWLITAGPAFLLLAAGLTVLFRNIPRLAPVPER